MTRIFQIGPLELHWPLSLVDCALAVVDVIAWLVVILEAHR